jgi:2-(3-amino-3-carboxypropyl)histidine synthase
LFLVGFLKVINKPYFMLQINLENAILELNLFNAKKIYLQIPEGLKTKTNEILDQLKKAKFDVITSMDPCFGACDLKENEAKQTKCDAILHVGHNAFVEKTTIPVVYAPLNYNLKNFEKIINKLILFLQKEKITKTGFVTTIQYINYLPKIKKSLAKNKIEMITQKGKRVIEGQVLGCNYSAVAKTKHTIYFGDGLFHPLGIHFSKHSRITDNSANTSTEICKNKFGLCEVIIVNPINETITMLDEEKNKFLRNRILLIEKAKEASSFAILVTTKLGQNRTCEAKKIKEKLEQAGKNANIYIMDFISEEKLLGINESAYISTVCPRLAIDDFKSYKKPIINFTEIDYLLGKSYDDYKLEEVY